ncbi:hypothetical protein PFISCL1PPCAC_18272, partial [Pristionchus fissidentatus]
CGVPLEGQLVEDVGDGERLELLPHVLHLLGYLLHALLRDDRLLPSGSTFRSLHLRHLSVQLRRQHLHVLLLPLQVVLVSCNKHLQPAPLRFDSDRLLPQRGQRVRDHIRVALVREVQLGVLLRQLLHHSLLSDDDLLQQLDLLVHVRQRRLLHLEQILRPDLLAVVQVVQFGSPHKGALHRAKSLNGQVSIELLVARLSSLRIPQREEQHRIEVHIVCLEGDLPMALDEFLYRTELERLRVEAAQPALHVDFHQLRLPARSDGECEITGRGGIADDESPVRLALQRLGDLVLGGARPVPCLGDETIELEQRLVPATLARRRRPRRRRHRSR